MNLIILLTNIIIGSFSCMLILIQLVNVLSLDSKFPLLRELKEKYISFNNFPFSSDDTAMAELIRLFNECKASGNYIFQTLPNFLISLNVKLFAPLLPLKYPAKVTRIMSAITNVFQTVLWNLLTGSLKIIRETRVVTPISIILEIASFGLQEKNCFQN